MVEHERKPSPRKAEVAQQKARDPTTGRFLSEGERQAADQYRQQLQIQAEQNRVNALLGRTQQPTQYGQPSIVQPIPQDNFQAILGMNKPGTETDINRWNTLLGRKPEKDNSPNRKRYRW